MSLRAAASLILVRDGADGLETLLVKRSEHGDFPGLHVFPGGLVDTADGSDFLAGRSARSAADAAALLKHEDDNNGALACFVAAVREALEEVGVLLVHEPGLSSIDHPDALLNEWQDALTQRRTHFSDLLMQSPVAETLRLATDVVGYFSHWVTPAGIPKRYDTRFLVARMPESQVPRIDSREVVSADWFTPGGALAAHHRGEIKLIFPTLRNLEALGRFTNTQELLDVTLQPRDLPMMLPKITSSDGRMKLLLPGDTGYDEA